MTVHSKILLVDFIQRNLFDVCVRFRLHKYVFSPDIIKMFRQIWINKHHSNYQRIVWREHPSAPLLHCQLCTVTYGTACALFLAVRVLEQLARDYQHLHPTAARILLEDFYVDDVLTGADTKEKLLQYKQELTQLMSCAQLKLGKWISNSSRVVDPETTITINTSYSPLETTNKVLGIIFGNLPYKKSLPSEGKITKRQVVSHIRPTWIAGSSGYSIQNPVPITLGSQLRLGQPATAQPGRLVPQMQARYPHAQSTWGSTLHWQLY